MWIEALELVPPDPGTCCSGMEPRNAASSQEDSQTWCVPVSGGLTVEANPERGVGDLNTTSSSIIIFMLNFLLSWAPSWHGGLDFDNLCFCLWYCLYIQNWANGFVHPYFLQISHLVAMLLTLVPKTRNTLLLPLLGLLHISSPHKNTLFSHSSFLWISPAKGRAVVHRNVYKASACLCEPLKCCVVIACSNVCLPDCEHAEAGSHFTLSWHSLKLWAS